MQHVSGLKSQLVKIPSVLVKLFVQLEASMRMMVLHHKLNMPTSVELAPCGITTHGGRNHEDINVIPIKPMIHGGLSTLISTIHSADIRTGLDNGIALQNLILLQCLALATHLHTNPMKMMMTSRLVTNTALYFTVNQLRNTVQIEIHLFDVHLHLNRILRAGTEEQHLKSTVSGMVTLLHGMPISKKLVHH